jgi:hypothetical protein
MEAPAAFKAQRWPALLRRAGQSYPLERPLFLDINRRYRPIAGLDEQEYTDSERSLNRL